MAVNQTITKHKLNTIQDMKKLKIAVYAISKNEEQFVNRFCDSAKDADVILIADTGSTDRTVGLALENGAVVHDICISPWRFDKARDTALALLPRDIDVCISLDLDEILEEGWREEIERVWQENTTRLRYKFDWGCGISFFYEKIHHRHGYHWHHPVHEYPRPDGRIQEIYAHTDMLLVSHHPDNTKSRGQYMPLLELAVKEDPHCPRNAFYHARELTFYYRWQDAIVALNKYLAMPEATWQNERCYAMRLLGKAHEELGQSLEAHKWYRLAITEAPNTREPWCELAMFCYRRSLWVECYSAAKSALEIKDKALVYTMNPEVWGAQPWDLGSISAWHLGLKEEATQLLQEAIKLAPDDQRLRNNLQLMDSDYKTFDKVENANTVRST
jgi:tetratricopeptide (TPR) repeat protein